jgi:hypothetical protein
MSVHPWESTGRTRRAVAPSPSSWWRCLALWALATTGTATRASAQTPADAPGATVTGTIVGTVREANGTPVRDATILLVDVPREPVTTDGFGRYVLRAVPAGTRRLFVSASGLAPARRAVTVPAGDTAHVDIALQRSVLELAGVTVSATATSRDPLAVTQPVTTLGPRELERSLGATLTQTLSWTAGVTARSQGPAATMPVIRGLTGERIVVLHDGQRAGDPRGQRPRPRRDHRSAVGAGSRDRAGAGGTAPRERRVRRCGERAVRRHRAHRSRRAPVEPHGERPERQRGGRRTARRVATVRPVDRAAAQGGRALAWQPGAGRRRGARRARQHEHAQPAGGRLPHARS